MSYYNRDNIFNYQPTIRGPVGQQGPTGPTADIFDVNGNLNMNNRLIYGLTGITFSNNTIITPDPSGNLLIDPSLNLVIGSGSNLTLQPTNNISTTLVPYGLNINSPSIKTYPTTTDFRAYPLYSSTAELGTNQTYNTSTGFNFIYGDNRSYTKSAGTTSDIERLYFTGFQQNFAWNDANTCKQYTGFIDNFNYNGINANSRTSSFFGAGNITLNCPTGSTQTITNVRCSESLRIEANNANATYTITNSTAPNLIFSGSTTNVIANITNHSFFQNSPSWDSTWSGAGSLATITNMFGLRLNPPSGENTTGLTITNNWGIFSGWSLAKNYFAGGVGIGTTTPTCIFDINGATMRIRNPSTIGATTSPGNTGDIVWNDDYIYVRVSNGWKRANLNSW
jgi:hypothetical protein